VAAVLAALLVGWIGLRARQREDMLIGAVWAVGMAVGILAIARTPGYSTDLMSYLLGNLLMVTRDQVAAMAVLDAAVILLLAALHRPVIAVAFDEEFARLRGIRVEIYVLVLLVLVALTVVLLVTVVGVVLVIALLTLPAAIAGQFTTTLRGMMAVASLLAVGFTSVGLALSYAPDLPAGATTIVLAGVAYLAVLAVKAVIARWRSRTASQPQL
jgi:zinc transport system permease protein